MNQRPERDKAVTSTNKMSSGIIGLDDILQGGYLTGLPTLIKGGPGTGKTVFTLSFVAGRLNVGEPAVIVTCDESPAQLVRHMDALGMSGSAHLDSGKLDILDFRPVFQDAVVGEYLLSPILERIAGAMEKAGATNLVLDSLQNLLLGLGVINPGTELLELFEWGRERSITLLATTTGDQGQSDDLLEEYAVDSVVHLRQTIEFHLMTRYLRVVKARGSPHGTNEYPFCINEKGASLMPITSAVLGSDLRGERITTGVAAIDSMLGGQGYQQGSMLLVSGTSGTGKTVLASTIAAAALEQGQKVAYISFEESTMHLVNDVASVNIDLVPAQEQGRLVIEHRREVERGLEDHLVAFIDLVEREAPDLLIIDPVSALLEIGSNEQVRMLLIRFFSYIQRRKTTLLLNELIPDYDAGHSNLAVSNLVDIWIRLRRNERDSEMNRLIGVVKSRGSKCSRQVKEFKITDEGIRL